MLMTFATVDAAEELLPADAAEELLPELLPVRVSVKSAVLPVAMAAPVEVVAVIVIL